MTTIFNLLIFLLYDNHKVISNAKLLHLTNNNPNVSYVIVNVCCYVVGNYHIFMMNIDFYYI